MLPVPIGNWIDLIIHVRFSETNRGVLEVWHRTGDSAWPVDPQIRRAGIPTMQFIPGGVDPHIPRTIHTSSLYDAFGLYKGGNAASRTDVVYFDMC